MSVTVLYSTLCCNETYSVWIFIDGMWRKIVVLLSLDQNKFKVKL